MMSTEGAQAVLSALVEDLYAAIGLAVHLPDAFLGRPCETQYTLLSHDMTSSGLVLQMSDGLSLQWIGTPVVEVSWRPGQVFARVTLRDLERAIACVGRTSREYVMGAVVIDVFGLTRRRAVVSPEG
jgi:hypothetical protein